jgi:hypothetical protein
MSGVEAKKPAPPIEENPRIVAGALEGLAEYRAGKGKSFDSIEDLIAYLEMF